MYQCHPPTHDYLRQALKHAAQPPDEVNYVVSSALHRAPHPAVMTRAVHLAHQASAAVAKSDAAASVPCTVDPGASRPPTFNTYHLPQFLAKHDGKVQYPTQWNTTEDITAGDLPVASKRRKCMRRCARS
jgi:hypothetical protein